MSIQTHIKGGEASIRQHTRSSNGSLCESEKEFFFKETFRLIVVRRLPWHLARNLLGIRSLVSYLLKRFFSEFCTVNRVYYKYMEYVSVWKWQMARPSKCPIFASMHTSKSNSENVCIFGCLHNCLWHYDERRRRAAAASSSSNAEVNYSTGLWIV